VSAREVHTDDLVQGASKYLAEFDDVRQVIGFPLEADSPYLFQHTLWVRMEGTGETAAVISRSGSWAGANVYNTVQYPRLGLELYVDPQRDEAKNVIDPGEAYRRIDAAWQVFDRHLHRPDKGDIRWGTVRTLACIRLGEPNVYPVPSGDGMLRMHTFYAVTVG
jgi:hypothetical protein